MKISQKNLEIIEESRCVGCNSCMGGCPMLDRFCESPKDLLEALQVTGEFDYNLAHSCMLCGYCASVCQADVDLKSLFLNLRRDVVKETGGKLPKILNTRGIDLHQKLSFSKLLTSEIQSLGSDTVFFPGCALLSNNAEAAERTYNYLKSKLPGIGIYTKCCGTPTMALGKDDAFRHYYDMVNRELRDNHVTKLITGCQNCYATMGEHYRDIEVLSLWEVLAEIGIPEDRRGMGRDTAYRFTIHDPCSTRSRTATHDAVRSIVAALEFEVHEMTYNREQTLCCGAGGMVSVTKPDIAKPYMHRRKDEAPTDHIITYCQECAESMRSVGKDTYHILDLLFDDDYEGIEHRNKGLIEKWANRYRSKSIGK